MAGIGPGERRVTVGDRIPAGEQDTVTVEVAAATGHPFAALPEQPAVEVPECMLWRQIGATLVTWPASR